MLPDRVSNPGPLTYESGVLPIALRGPTLIIVSLLKTTENLKHYFLTYKSQLDESTCLKYKGINNSQKCTGSICLFLEM